VVRKDHFSDLNQDRVYVSYRDLLDLHHSATKRICVCDAVHFQVRGTPVVKRMNLPTNSRMSREKTACEQNNQNPYTDQLQISTMLVLIFFYIILISFKYFIYFKLFNVINKEQILVIKKRNPLSI